MDNSVENGGKADGHLALDNIWQIPWVACIERAATRLEIMGMGFRKKHSVIRLIADLCAEEDL